MVYCQLSGEDDSIIRKAIQAYQETLQVFSATYWPYEYGVVQCELGYLSVLLCS